MTSRMRKLKSRRAMSDMVISDRQLAVHRLTEAASIFIQVPFMIWLASNKNLPGWARFLSGALAVGALVVDGGLLQTWAAKERGERGIWG